VTLSKAMSVRPHHRDRDPHTSAGAEARAASPETIARIAVGVDGSPQGRDAVTLGALIANATAAELMLVRVLPDPSAPLLTVSDPKREAQAALTELRDSIAPGARIATETDLSVPSALQRVVRRERCELLVVGSSRRGADGRVRIGTCTRHLLSSLDCALAIAPRGMERHQHRELRKIGVGYDAGPESEAAFSLAGSLAAAADAELHVRAVVDDRVRTLVRSALGSLVATEWTDVIAREKERLRNLTVAAAQAIDPYVYAHVLPGHPSEVLLSLSSEVDLIVVGSRRWGPIARLVLGSTGEAVVHDAACPVLAVPRPKEDEKCQDL
jgi:nucleotide-binding universal stress UspA family protein